MKQYDLLDKINNPGDINLIDDSDLEQLCCEIRDFLLENLSKTGGHLSSNLGVVELTVALHRNFDTSVDRVLFDVGHQTYIHKIMTGRKDKFDKLRCFGGISGFSNPRESIHDAFVSGHASNSISVALGMARARTILNDDYSVVAVIGDGALTGGLAYEALNNVCAVREPLIIILNDNEMSITRNVGGMSKYLMDLRAHPNYLKIKENIKDSLNSIPGGDNISDVIGKIKSGFKSVILHNTFFEEIGFKYIGPIDGHDVISMSKILKIVKEYDVPVILHTITKKGKGYPYSEQDPQKYHGVSKFNVDTGESLNSVNSETFSSVFGRKMVDLGEQDGKICAVTAAMEIGSSLTKFSEKFGNRYCDVGIAEAHAVAMAAGMAKQGLKPVCAIYSTFLQRALDQLIHDVAIDNLNVVFAVDRAGIVGEDGETHNGVFDVGFIRNIPNFSMFAPSNYSELESMLIHGIYNINGPVAVRYPRGCEGDFKDDTSVYSTIRLRSGKDITIISYGIMINEAIIACNELELRGIGASLFKINDLTNLDLNEISVDVCNTHTIVVLEDCVDSNCIGNEILSLISGTDISNSMLINLGNRFISQGSVPNLYKYCGLDGFSVSEKIMEVFFD